MTDETYLERLKREREEHDREAIKNMLPRIMDYLAEGVEKRKKTVRVPVDKTIIDILNMGECDVNLFFYEKMSELGLDGSAISWESYTERPPYTYTLILEIGV